MVLATLALFGCGEDAPDSPSNNADAAEKPLSAAELQKARATSRASYEAFIKSSDAAIESELGKCRSAVLDDLKRDHLNAMLSDNPGRTVSKMKRDAKNELKRFESDPTAPGLDVVMESVNFCTFDRPFSERLVQQGSAFCEFKDGKYSQHGIGELTEVPKGLAYTCDGYGL